MHNIKEKETYINLNYDLMPIRWKYKKYWINKEYIFKELKKHKSIILPLDYFNIDEEYERLKLDRVKKANLKYSITIDPNYEILDGLHRIKKAKMLNKKIIRCKIFNPEKYIEKMIRVKKYDFGLQLKSV